MPHEQEILDQIIVLVEVVSVEMASVGIPSVASRHEVHDCWIMHIFPSVPQDSRGAEDDGGSQCSRGHESDICGQPQEMGPEQDGSHENVETRSLLAFPPSKVGFSPVHDKFPPLIPPPL